MFSVCVHRRDNFAEAGADGAAQRDPSNADDAYESRIGMRHWSVNQTTIPGLLMDLYDNGGSTQLSGEEIAETVLDLLRRMF